MGVPAPEPGLVIGYSYLWEREARLGRAEGRKDRPAVIVVSVKQESGRNLVAVLAVTHTAPCVADSAVEIPGAVKRHLGLDEARSWIVVSEINEFVWPGYDLRRIPGLDRFDYGFLPPRLYTKVKSVMEAWDRKNRVASVSRD